MNNILEKIELVPLIRLKLWKDNPRVNDVAVPKLMKLIKKHGIKSPIVVWKKNNVIYKGNTTYKAAKKLGYKKLPVAWASFPSEAAANAYGISDNKSSEFTEWDEELLLKIMDKQELKPYIEEGLGFEEKELDSLLFRPNLSKIDNIEETDEGILARITVLCKPDIKEDVLNTMRKVLNRKYPEQVAIK